MSGGKNIPAWLSDKKKKALRKDEEYRRRIELIQVCGCCWRLLDECRAWPPWPKACVQMLRICLAYRWPAVTPCCLWCRPACPPDHCLTHLPTLHPPAHLQDFEFPAGCQRIKVTPDGQYIFASGYHPPQVRCGICGVCCCRASAQLLLLKQPLLC